MPKHKIAQTGSQRLGRPESGYTGVQDTRASNFGPMRSRMGYMGESMGMGMHRMGPRYPYAGAMPYSRYGADGGPSYGPSGFGYGMYGRYGGYGMEGYSGYSREPGAMAAYYSRGYGAGPYGYGYPASYGYGNVYGGRFGYSREGGAYRRTTDVSPGGSPGRGAASRSYGSPVTRRGGDDEGEAVPLAGGDVDIKPNISQIDSRFDRDRERDRQYSGSTGRSGMRTHGYHPYAR